MADQKFYNSFVATGSPDAVLDGAINDSVTTLAVLTLPATITAAEFDIKIDGELIHVGAIGGTGNKTWSSLTRGYGNSTAVSHLDAAEVFLVFTAEAARGLQDYNNLDNIPTSFAPAVHATSHENGGGDELEIDWSQLASVPTTFAPTSHDHTAAGAGGVLTGDEHDSFSEYDEIAAPATPASGKVRIYAKSDGHPYAKDDAGTEYDLASAAGAFDLGDAGDVVITAPADGEVLTYDSGSGNWVNEAPGGGGGDVSLITRTVVGVGGAASVTFSSIPGTYEDLRVVLMGRGEAAVTNIGINLTFNGDTGSNYDWQRMFATGTNTLGSSGAAAAAIMEVGNFTGSTGPANAAGQIIVDILAYARTVFQKCVLTSTAIKHVTTNGNYVMRYAGWWRSTAAITQVTLTPASGDFAEGTVVSLFGVN